MAREASVSMNHDQRQTEGGRRRGRMLAREWTIAALYHDPSDHGIPALPDWASGRDAAGRFALADSAADEPFILADEPVEVER
jgi:hypothetical protein